MAIWITRGDCYRSPDTLSGRSSTALVVYGPTSSLILDALEANGIDAKLPEDTPSAELLNQYRSWFSLGGTAGHLGYPIRWLLGDPQSGRWVEFTHNATNLVWHDSMPQPDAFTSFRMDSIPTSHSVPSCAWQLSRKERKGAFDRDRATLAGLNQDERKQLSEGIDLERDNGDLLQASQFRGPAKPATSIVVSGDTPNNPSNQPRPSQFSSMKQRSSMMQATRPANISIVRHQGQLEQHWNAMQSILF